MPCSIFILRVDRRGTTDYIIKNSRYYPETFNEALSKAKTVHQTQSNPDSEGNVIITITMEH